MDTAQGTRTNAVETPKGAAIFMIGAVVLLWLIEIVDRLLVFVNLEMLGIHSWNPGGLIGILFAPFLHSDWSHLASNSLPLAVLGFLILVGGGGIKRFLVATILSALGSGMFAWVLSIPPTLIIGASGVVFGFLTYLIMRGVFARDWKSIIISIVVLVVYGSVLLGVLPGTPGVSWQGHLGGAVGGVLAAYLMHSRAKKKARR